MIAAATWPNPDRYRNHREREYSPPPSNGNLPYLLTQALQRLPSLFEVRNGRLPWDVRGIQFKHPTTKTKVKWPMMAITAENAAARGAGLVRVRMAIHHTHHHRHKKKTRHGSDRRRRDQAVRSRRLVLTYLLARCNVQLHHATFQWLECNEASYEQISRATGLSYTAVRGAIYGNSEDGWLRTARRFEIREDGTRREITPRYWLTPHLFAALGLAKKYVRQLLGEPAAKPEPKTTHPTQAPAAAPATPITAEQRTTGRRAITDLRGALSGRPPPKPA